MTDDPTLELGRMHHAASDKYTYFLLAAVGAAIGFALNQTRDLPLSWTQLPLGAAIICWGLSFYFGCRRLTRVMALLHENRQFIRLTRGELPDFPNDPKLIAEIAEIFQKRAADANQPLVWQFKLLIAGGVLYVIWHLTEMYMRTANGG
jgi:hypothetical protein